MKKLSKVFMCFVWLMLCLKKLLMVCSHSKLCATRFFIDDNDLGAELDREFVLTKKNFEKLPICSLMDQVKTRSVALNLYYSVGDYARNDIMRTENFGEIFFEISNNPFGVYIVYLQIYFRVSFNLLKSVTEVLIDNYLFEHACKETVSKIKKNQ